MSINLQGGEMVILNRLFRPRKDLLPVAAARAILKIEFEESDQQRMRELSSKARLGTLTSEEKQEIDSYEVVGHLLGLLHSKARQALNKRNSSVA